MTLISLLSPLCEASVTGPIRVFVGTDPNGCDAESLAVLEYTLHKHASEPVEIVLMRHSRNPENFWSGWDGSAWATPFSGFRAGIPAYCGFDGKAIYTDSDVWFQQDIAELWRQPIPQGAVVLGKGGGSWRLCVSLWSCAAAKKYLPPIEELRRNSRSWARATSDLRQKGLIAPFKGDWNCLDGDGYVDLTDSHLKALHATNMSTQPHLKYAIPRLEAAGQRHWFDGKVRPHPRADVQALFDRLLVEAAEAGYTVDRYVPAEPFGEYRKASLVNYRGAA